MLIEARLANKHFSVCVICGAAMTGSSSDSVSESVTGVVSGGADFFPRGCRLELLPVATVRFLGAGSDMMESAPCLEEESVGWALARRSATGSESEDKEADSWGLED